MRPTTVTLNSTGYTSWIPVDYAIATFNVGVQVMPSVGADVVWSVQYTLDDPYTTLIPRPVAAPDNLKTGTGYEIGNITVPCRAVRLAGTIASGEIDFTVVQGRK
jgi:hypothetical protein